MEMQEMIERLLAGQAKADADKNECQHENNAGKGRH
jgi:hypothetical protein